MEPEAYDRKSGLLSTARPRIVQPALAQARLFFALSRTPHVLIDIAAPVLAALLWYGGFPPAPVLWLGIFTAFAGYTSVYALNDIIDYPADRERYARGLYSGCSDDLDSICMRHPIASGQLSPVRALIWTVVWALAALAGAFLLNPFCIVIFVAACLLETVYCLAWQTSCLKVFVSGAVKTAGPLAAVYAVDRAPSPWFLAVLFAWLFFWELGGQNIPNDWADIDEDRELEASTLPVRFGPALTANAVLVSLVLTVCLGASAVISSRVPNLPAAVAVSVGVGAWFLLIPALRLYVARDREAALRLFNRACYYPAAMLAGVAVCSLI